MGFEFVVDEEDNVSNLDDLKSLVDSSRESSTNEIQLGNQNLIDKMEFAVKDIWRLLYETCYLITSQEKKYLGMKFQYRVKKYNFFLLMTEPSVDDTNKWIEWFDRWHIYKSNLNNLMR
jgi:hypothetical protein